MMAARLSIARAGVTRVALYPTLPTSMRYVGVRAFSVRAPPTNSQSTDARRMIETPIVQNADNTLMRWVGRGSAMQMYCAIVFAGKLVLDADAAANVYEVWATSGAIASASACVFFGAKMLCDRIVTDIASCRNFGEKDEYVRLTIQGALDKYALLVSLDGWFILVLADIQLLEQPSSDKYKFKVGERNFTLDLARGQCTNRKTLENLLEGKPLIARKGKHPKKSR